MPISGMLFLFCFLPMSLAIYYFSKESVRDYVLLVISLLFYAVGSIDYLLLIMIAMTVTVAIGRHISSIEDVSRKKSLLLLGILLNAGLLYYYKYVDFVVATFGRIMSIDIEQRDLLLPLGISFYTFKAISYLVDIYKGRAELAENAVHDVLYLSFFAQIQSGPLSRYNEMKGDGKGSFDFQLFSQGVYRFLIGYSKKVLIADVLSNVTREIFHRPFDEISTAYIWLGSICFSLQLFFDFAGYSDMAIGITGMFGYKCRENFNYPYMTASVSEFWRRWHISLGDWFRDYIYIPLGGSRVDKKWRLYFNLLVVWFLTGIWHGASWNFIIWGIGYFIFITFEKVTNIPNRMKSVFSKTIYRIVILAFINFQWVMFNSSSFTSAIKYIKQMLFYNTNELADLRTVYLLKEYLFFIIAAIVFSFPIIPKLDEKMENKKMFTIVYKLLKMAVIIIAFYWGNSFVVAGQYNPFAYANF